VVGAHELGPGFAYPPCHVRVIGQLVEGAEQNVLVLGRHEQVSARHDSEAAHGFREGHGREPRGHGLQKLDLRSAPELDGADPQITGPVVWRQIVGGAAGE
jgi:hypothetical protein